VTSPEKKLEKLSDRTARALAEVPVYGELSNYAAQSAALSRKPEFELTRRATGTSAARCILPNNAAARDAIKFNVLVTRSVRQLLLPYFTSTIRLGRYGAPPDFRMLKSLRANRPCHRRDVMT